MARQAPNLDEISDIYLDESSQTKHRYLVIGGIIVPTSRATDLSKQIAAARLPELPMGEMAWTKVSRGKLVAYKRVVSLFFDMTPTNLIEFHSLVVDTSMIKDFAFNSGSRETGFNKEIYQLLRKFGRLHKRRLFHVYLDKRNTKSKTEDLRTILNRGIAKAGDARDWPYRRVHFRESCDCNILQLVDIMLGALAFRLNGHRDAQGASPAKCELSDYVLSRSRLRDPSRDTAVTGKLTIWHRRLR